MRQVAKGQRSKPATVGKGGAARLGAPHNMEAHDPTGRMKPRTPGQGARLADWGAKLTPKQAAAARREAMAARRDEAAMSTPPRAGRPKAGSLFGQPLAELSLLSNSGQGSARGRKQKTPRSPKQPTAAQKQRAEEVLRELVNFLVADENKLRMAELFRALDVDGSNTVRALISLGFLVRSAPRFVQRESSF
jgi:hypothetical protein